MFYAMLFVLNLNGRLQFLHINQKLGWTKLEIVYFLRILQKEILMIGLIFRPKMINCFQQGSVFPNAVFLQKNLR